MGNLLRKVLGDSFIYAVLPRLSRIASILILPFITKFLTPYDYGVTGILFAYVHVFEGFRNLGLDVVFVNSFFKQNDAYKEIWGKLFGFLTIWAIPYGVLISGIAYFALPPADRDKFYLIILYVIFPIVFFDHTIDLGQKYLQLNKKAFVFSMVSLVVAFMVLGAEYVTIVYYKMGFMGFFASDFLGKTISFVCYIFLMGIKIRIFPNFHFSFAWLRSQLAVSIPAIPHAYAAYLLNTSDRLLLNLFHISVPLVGLYSFAYSFAANFSKIGQSMLIAGRPIMMELFAKEKRNAEIQARNLVWLLQAGLLAAGFLLSLWIKEIFSFLASNEDLRMSYVYAPILIMAYTYYPIYFGAINKLYYLEKTKVFWKISFVAALINIGLNVLLIPALNVWGATITTFVSYLFMGFSAYAQKDFKKNNFVGYKELLWLYITIALTVIVFYVKDTEMYVKAYITAAILLTALVFGLFLKQKKIGSDRQRIAT